MTLMSTDEPFKTTTTVLCTHHLNFIHLDLS